MHFRIGRLTVQWRRGRMSRNRTLAAFEHYLSNNGYLRVDIKVAVQVVETHRIGTTDKLLEDVLWQTYLMDRMSVRLRNNLTLNFTSPESLDLMVEGWITSLIEAYAPEGLAVMLAGCAYQAALEYRISFADITKLFADQYNVPTIRNEDVEPVHWVVTRKLAPIMPRDRILANRIAELWTIRQERAEADQSTSSVTADAT